MTYCLTQALHSTPIYGAKIFQTRGQLQLLLILNYILEEVSLQLAKTPETVVFLYAITTISSISK